MSQSVPTPAPRSPASALVEKFRSHQATIGVLGLGYAGLPLATTIAEAGFATIGFDIDATKVRALGRGQSYIRHLPSSRLAPILAAEPPVAGQGRFFPSGDYGLLARCDALLICVPTPLTERREPDLSYVIRTTESIARHLHPGSSWSSKAQPTRGRLRRCCGPFSSAAG